MHPGFTSGYWGSCPCWARLPLWSCVHGFHGWFPCWWCRVQTGCSPCPCGSFPLCGSQRRRQPARRVAFMRGERGGRAVVGCFCCPCSCVLVCQGAGRCFFSGGAGPPPAAPALLIVTVWRFCRCRRFPPGGSARKGGTRPAAPPASAPDDTACILHTGLPATDRRPRRRLNPYPAHRRRGGGFTRACTQSFVYKNSPAGKSRQGNEKWLKMGF